MKLRKGSMIVFRNLSLGYFNISPRWFYDRYGRVKHSRWSPFGFFDYPGAFRGIIRITGCGQGDQGGGFEAVQIKDFDIVVAVFLVLGGKIHQFAGGRYRYFGEWRYHQNNLTNPSFFKYHRLAVHISSPDALVAIAVVAGCRTGAGCRSASDKTGRCGRVQRQLANGVLVPCCRSATMRRSTCYLPRRRIILYLTLYGGRESELAKVCKQGTRFKQ